MRISLMIGTGGGDGGSPVDHYVDEPPCQVTTGSGRVWSFSAPRGWRRRTAPSSRSTRAYGCTRRRVRESFSLITRATAPCSGSRTRPWHTRRAAVVVGQAIGLFPVLADAA